MVLLGSKKPAGDLLMSSEAAIVVSDVSKCFEMYDKPRDRLRQFFASQGKKHYREFWALKNVSFEVARGETIGILGRNGSGKSTLLQIIASTLAPSSGDVQVNGLLAALLELGSGFNPDFTGRENVYLNGAVLGFTRAQMTQRFAEIEAFADIGEHIDQPVRTYSSGMYVRLAFAVQACVDPQVLIVDEALSVGDEKFQRKCFEYIEGLRSRGCAILIVTHSTATVEKFCQRAVLLHEGRMHGVGDAKTIIDQYHALLYSDEKAYLRFVNARSTDAMPADGEAALEAARLEGNHSSLAEPSQEQQVLRAYIAGWSASDAQGDPCEVFLVGSTVWIRVHVRTLTEISEMQVGLLIRTVEGVSVFGTSTMYHGVNQVGVRPDAIFIADFEIALNLGEGSYFVTLALAESISRADMRYLDRKTDAIILRVSDPRVVGTGIAALPVKVTFAESSSDSSIREY